MIDINQMAGVSAGVSSAANGKKPQRDGHEISTDIIQD